MSEDNVEIVRGVWRRFNSDGSVDPRSFDPSIEIENYRESPIPGPYRGYEGMRQWAKDVVEVIEDAQYEIEELLDFDVQDAVVARMHLRGRARFSGIEIDIPMTVVFRFRGKRIVGAAGYRNHGEALEAAGLSD